MESLSNNDLKTKNDLEEDPNSSTIFLRRRKTVIFIFTFFFISLALIIGALIVYLIRDTASESDRDSIITLNPAIQTFNTAANCHTEFCLESFNRAIGNKSFTNPNQIFILALQTAAKDLRIITSLIKDDNNPESAFKNCSNSQRDSLSRIGDALAIMRVNPFVEKLSDEQKGELVHRIAQVDVILKLCIDDLEKVVEKSTAVIEVRAQVLEAEVYVSSSEEFLLNYKEVLQNSASWRKISVDWGMMFVDNLFVICVCGLQLLFIIFLFWSVIASR